MTTIDPIKQGISICGIGYSIFSFRSKYNKYSVDSSSFRTKVSNIAGPDN